MKYYYSKSTGGFYVSAIHGSPDDEGTIIPKDAKELSADEYNALMVAQVSGKDIVAGTGGKPVAKDPPAPSDDELAYRARNKRAAMLRESDWTQVDDAPLDNVEKAAWAQYRQALREITDQESFPKTINWPTAPGA